MCLKKLFKKKKKKRSDFEIINTDIRQNYIRRLRETSINCDEAQIVNSTSNSVQVRFTTEKGWFTLWFDEDDVSKFDGRVWIKKEAAGKIHDFRQKI